MRVKLAKFRMTVLLGLVASAGTGLADAPSISDNPLFLVSSGRANVLVILDNSNSMDEDASGAAVGSNNAASKSEIARGVIRSLIDTYTGRVNMGLMAYKQNATSDYYLHNSPYDVSYDEDDYDTSWTGDRADATHKKYRVDNPASTNSDDYIYYNVALPFYSSSNQGNGFCYSNTSVAFNNGEVPPTSGCNNGPWDTYRCYSVKTGSSNVIPAMNGSNAGTYGYSGSTFSTAFCPTDSDLAQGITDFGKLNTYNYVSRAYFRNDSPGRGYLHVPIKLLDATQATALKNKLKCNIPGAASPCDTTNGLKNAGLTPIEGTLLTAKDYFGGSWNTASEGYVSGTGATSSYPLPDSCGKNFVILVTDGLPSTDKNGNALTSPTTAITQAAAAAAALKTANIETYVVGFALPYGVDPATLNTIAASGGTNTAYNANDQATLNDALSNIFIDILNKTTSAAAIAANSTRVNTETLVYQARFNSAEWSGEIHAIKLNEDGSLGSTVWDTDTTMASIAADTRKVWTWNPTTATGVSFAWDNLSTAQQTALNKNGAGTTDSRGQERVNWLRGNNTITGFRERAKILGDVVNSDPAFVSAENYGYVIHADANAGGQGYLNFLTTKQSRKKMLYVGANDGMLHGFDADTGVEQFAYIPAALYDKLSRLTEPTYNHKYFVDGGPVAWDACIGPAGSYTSNATGTPVTVSTTCTWRTILLGSLGAGGKAIYALNVTDPTDSNFGKPIWEFTHDDLGYLSGPPQVIKLQSGDWAAIFGNGYRSKNCEDLINNVTNASRNCNAKLFAVNLSTGALISGFPIDTGVGSSTNANGFVGASALYDVSTRILGDENDSGSNVGDGIYIGDLQGNVWRFLYKTAGGWQVAYKTGSTPSPLFVAKDDSSNAQPITAPLEVGEPPIANQGVMVYVGTGRYFADTDPSNTARQTFYGIWDQGAKVTYTTRSSTLQLQSIIKETVAFSRNVRLVSNTAVTWSGTGAKSGWYMDLVSPDNVNRGERVVSAPLLRFGRTIFNTVIPSTSACSAGGTSWLMEVDALTGGRLGYSVFDLNNDKLFNSADYVNDNSNTPVPVSGLGSPVGITKTPAVVSAGDREYKVQTGTDLSGANQGMLVTGESGTGKPRGAWRQIFQDDGGSCP